MAPLVGNPIASRDQQIADIAYRLWQEEGYPDGRADAHWLRAVEMLEAESAKKPKLKLVASNKGRKRSS